MKFAGTLLAAFAVAGAVSCNYSQQKNRMLPDTGSAAVSDISWLMDNLFHPSCVSCHNGGRQPGGFRFETTADLLSAVRTGGITPGNASGSVIFAAIESGRMPPGSNKPSAEILAVLRCWIDAGATESSASCAPQSSQSGNARPSSDNPTPQPPPAGNDDNGGHSGDDGNGQDDDDDDGDDDDDDGDDDGGGTATGSDAGSPGGDDGGGAGDGNGGGGVPVSFASVNAILIQQCAGCHGDEYPSADVVLTSQQSIVNPPTGPALVNCGAASDSLLYRVVFDESMPMGGVPLSGEQKKLIFDWINGGCTP